MEEESAFVTGGRGDGIAVETGLEGCAGPGVMTRIADCPSVIDDADSVEGVAVESGMGEDSKGRLSSLAALKPSTIRADVDSPDAGT